MTDTEMGVFDRTKMILVNGDVLGDFTEHKVDITSPDTPDSVHF